MGRMKTRLVISLGIFGVLFTGFGITQTAFEMKPAKDYSSVSSYEIKKGDKLSGTIDLGVYNYAYEYDEDDSSKTVEYYLIPLPSSVEKTDDYTKWDYISYKTGNSSQQRIMDKIIDYTWGDADTPASIEFTGKVAPLDSDFEDFLYDGLIEAEYFGTTDRSEISKHISPYCIEYNAEGFGGVMLIIGLIPLALFIFILVMLFKKNGGHLPLRAAGGLRQSGESGDMPITGASPSYMQPNSAVPSYTQQNNTAPSYAQPSGTTPSYMRPTNSQPQQSAAQPMNMYSTPTSSSADNSSVSKVGVGFEDTGAGKGIMDELDLSSISTDALDDPDKKF